MDTMTQILVGGVSIGVVYALIASGFNLIFGVFRVLNAAHGDFFLLGGYVAYLLWAATDVHPLVLVPVAALAVCILGVAVQAGLVEHIHSRGIVVSLMLLFGVGSILRNVALILFGVDPRSIRHYVGAFDVFGFVQVSRARVVVMVVGITLMLAVHLFLKHAKMGVAIRATAENSQVAEACAINVRRVRLITMGLSSALAGAAGALVVMMLSIEPIVGLEYLVTALVVAVVGGLGSFHGSIYAGIALGLATAGFSWVFGSHIAVMGAYGIMLLVLLLRPQGIVRGSTV